MASLASGREREQVWGSAFTGAAGGGLRFLGSLFIGENIRAGIKRAGREEQTAQIFSYLK